MLLAAVFFSLIISTLENNLKISLKKFADSKSSCIFVSDSKTNKMATQLETNEFYRVNSYYWQGMVYIALEVKEDKTLCQIKGSKSKPKWIKTNQLSKTYKDFRNEN